MQQLTDTQTSQIEKLIKKNKYTLIVWDQMFQTHTINQILKLIKSELITSDEAFVIGYMIGVSAEKLVRNNADIHQQLNIQEVE